MNRLRITLGTMLCAVLMSLLGCGNEREYGRLIARDGGGPQSGDCAACKTDFDRRMGDCGDTYNDALAQCNDDHPSGGDSWERCVTNATTAFGSCKKWAAAAYLDCLQTRECPVLYKQREMAE